MTCKDCIHEKVCVIIAFLEAFENTKWEKEPCDHFKNKDDFVEVVHCRDCDVPHNKFTGCPKLNGLIPPPNYYCAGGERK